MRPSTSTFLAALLSLASIEPCQANEGANVPQRPRYYFPQLVKRQIDNSWVKRTVVVVPVTVKVGLDGKRTTLSPPPPQPSNPTAPVSYTETTITVPTSTVEEPSLPIESSEIPSEQSTVLPPYGTGPAIPVPTSSETVSSQSTASVSTSSSSSSSTQETQSSDEVTRSVSTSSSSSTKSATTFTTQTSEEPLISLSISLPNLGSGTISQTFDPSAGYPGATLSASSSDGSAESVTTSSTASSSSSESSSKTSDDNPWDFPTLLIPPKENITSVAEPSDYPGTGYSPPVSMTTTSGETSQTESSSASSDSSQLFPSLTIPTISLPIPTPSHNSTQPASSSEVVVSSSSLATVTSSTVFPSSSSAEFPQNGTFITSSTVAPSSDTESSSTRTVPSGVFPPSSMMSGTGTAPLPKVPISTSDATKSESATSSESSSAASESTSSVEKEPTSVIPVVTSTPSPVPTTTVQESTSVAISTDTETQMIIPTNVIYEPSRPSTTSSQTTTASETPVSLPNVIYSPAGRVEVPPNSVLIQLAFNGSLSYEFILNTADAVTQIFSYLPQGVRHGLGVDEKEVVMESIKPYDTLSELGYTTALNRIYIPKNLLGKMTEALVTANSKLYNHPKQPINTMMSMIDPTFPLIPGGNTPESGNSPDGGKDNPGSPDDKDGDDKEDEKKGNGAGGSGSASGVNSTSVGIGLGVVGGAALYGAAMFFVARRYRKKRKMHRRRSSLTSGLGDDEPAYTDNHDSSGYRSTTPAAGRDSRNSNGSGSARTQMISAPVMAENSLGWN